MVNYYLWRDKMKLTFVAGKDKASISKWNGVVVLLTSGEIGEQDVMFTGVTKSEKGLFAKLVEGVKVNSSNGLKTTGSMCIDVGYGHDVDMVEYEFSPGLLKQWLYISHYNPSFPQFTSQPLGGTYYLTYHKGMYRICGVDNPDMLYLFKEQHKDYKK